MAMTVRGTVSDEPVTGRGAVVVGAAPTVRVMASTAPTPQVTDSVMVPDASEGIVAEKLKFPFPSAVP
jgi:hypothetical protein